MLKKIVISTLVLLALSGCATHQQANTAVGAGTGAVIGNAIGGRGGAAVGALIGASIGGQQPTHQGQHVYMERQVIVPDHNMNQCHYQYDQRARGCDLKFRNDPYYGRHHYDACLDQAKMQWNSCKGYYR